jgi:hypothetical protein
MLRAAEDPSSAEAATVHEQNMWRFGSHVGQGGAFFAKTCMVRLGCNSCFDDFRRMAKFRVMLGP